jgi:hypothetical protein
LGYEKPVSTDAKAKILIGSFLPFSTASTHRVISRHRSKRKLSGAQRTLADHLTDLIFTRIRPNRPPAAACNPGIHVAGLAISVGSDEHGRR